MNRAKMDKRSFKRMALLTAGILAAHLLLTEPLPAAALKALRLGVTREKTRLVFEMDGAVGYVIQASDSGLTVRLEGLTASPGALSEALRSRGGLLKQVRHEASGGAFTFYLTTVSPARHKYFALKNPDRVVVDLLPATPAAKETAISVPANPPEQKPDVAGISPVGEQPNMAVPSRADTGREASDTLVQPPKSETPTQLQAQREELIQKAPPATGTNYLYYALPFIILGIGGVVLYGLARRKNRRRFGDEAFSELLEDRVDFQTLIKREAESQRTRVEAAAETIEKPQAPDRMEGGAEAAPGQPEIPQPKVETPRPHVPRGEAREDARAELSVENASLIWPVHLLDGGRVGRVMIVDDDPEIVRVMDDYLVGAGYEVQALTDSRLALESYPEWHPDLLILDVVMPQLDAIHFVQEIGEKGIHHKIIFLSGKSERDSVAAVFEEELRDGRYEFIRKPISLQQIGGRVRDYFSSAHEVLNLNLSNQADFAEQTDHLSPHQLAALHSFVWDRIFESSAELLGRRIESAYITDRMEPASNYMRRMGCQERRDYCIASKCIVSNPSCAAKRLRAELEVMRQILMEFRQEYMSRIGRGIGAEDLKTSGRGRRRDAKHISTSPKADPSSREDGEPPSVPPKRLSPRDYTERNR